MEKVITLTLTHEESVYLKNALYIALEHGLYSKQGYEQEADSLDNIAEVLANKIDRYEDKITAEATAAFIRSNYVEFGAA